MGMTISFSGDTAEEVSKLIQECAALLGADVALAMTDAQVEKLQGKKGNGSNGHAVAASEVDAAAPKRRGRPPKAETEAKAASTPAKEEEITDPFENPSALASEQAEEPEEVSVISASELKEAITTITDLTKKPQGVSKAQAILKKYDSAKIGEVPPKLFQSFLSDCKAELASA